MLRTGARVFGVAEHCCGCKLAPRRSPPWPSPLSSTWKQTSAVYMGFNRFPSQHQVFSTLGQNKRKDVHKFSELGHHINRPIAQSFAVIPNNVFTKGLMCPSVKHLSAGHYDRRLPSSVTHIPRCDIHKQGDNGRKQASRHFVLSPQGIVAASPNYVQPYLRLMRLDRPIGTWLLFLPCTWSISLAMPPGAFPDLYMLGLFALGSFFMRGAGCTVNDLWDKDYDSQVARTKDRPLACGQITNFQALAFLGAQLSASLAILLTLNWSTILLGTCSMLPVIVYPLMKRVTYWPQAFLGLTFNWGAVMGWSAVHGAIHWPVLTLYASCIAWTLAYDTIYAHQDKEDDILIGVKSTALKFGDDTKKWLTGFSSIMVGGLTLTGYLCDQTWIYYSGVAMVAAHLGRQIYTVDLQNSEDCGEKFRSNKYLGLMFWAMIVASNLKKKNKNKDPTTS